MNKFSAKNSSSKYIGVYNENDKWIARININGKHMHLRLKM